MAALLAQVPTLSGLFAHAPGPVRRVVSSYTKQALYDSNLRILWGTAGASTVIYLVWQYVDRNPSNYLGSPTYWSGVDWLVDTIAGTRQTSSENTRGSFQVNDGRTIVYESGSTSKLWHEHISTFMTNNFLFHLGDAGRRPWTLLTSAISHKSLGHLVANIAGFLEFGRCLSPSTSSSTLVGLMASCAVVGNVVWAVHAGLRTAGKRKADAKSKSSQLSSLGLSAVVQGMGVAVTYLHPWLMASPMGVIRLPLWVCTSAYLLADLVSVNQEGSFVSHAAHLGGGAVGLVFASVFLDKSSVITSAAQEIRRTAYL